MRYSLPVLVVVLVVTAMVAVGTPALSPATPAGPGGQDASQPAIAPVNTAQNTSNYLALPDGGEERSRFGNATLDFGAAVAVDSATLRERLDGQTAVERFQAAPNSSARTAVLRQAIDDLRNRTVAVRQYQQHTIEQFNAGRISATVLFRRFATIDSRSRAITSSVDRIQEAAQDADGYAPPFGLTARLNSVRQRAALFASPVRSNIAESLSGTRGGEQYLVRTSGQGYVLAGTARGRSIREAYIGTRFQQAGEDRFDGDLGTAIDFVYELYPWAKENQRRPYPDIEPLINSVYRVTINHEHGELQTYLDGSVTEIFLEIQEKRLSTLPVSRTVTAENETANLAVRVNLTYPTGPMELTVRDTLRNTSVDARIRVDGQFVGATGSDGRLWTIQPDDTVRIEAAVDGERVSLTATHDASGV